MNQPDAPVVVFEAPDEITAELVAGLLRSEGIVTTVQASGEHKLYVSWILGSKAGGPWGKVLVPAADEIRARQLMAAYQPDEPEPEQKLTDQSAER